ncbi:MAG TPA: hypothetical protein VF552_14940 [Allosphingosinicella sp.]|jgi:hypothetical protein
MVSRTSQPADTFYVDESGNSGDLARSDASMDFGRQEIFTLACVGARGQHSFSAEIERLRRDYRIQSAELKSSAVRGKPALVRELATFLGDQRLPLMIEVVDKRFMIAVNIVNTLIMPPVGACDVTPEAQRFRNILAEYIHAHAPAALFRAYVAACDAPSVASAVIGANAPSRRCPRSAKRSRKSDQRNLRLTLGRGEDAWARPQVKCATHLSRDSL